MHDYEHHKREVIFLISILLLFGIIFLIGILNLNRQIPTFDIGLNYQIENWLIIVLSFAAIIKVIWTMHSI